MAAKTLQQIIDSAAQIAAQIAGAKVEIDETSVELLLPAVLNNVLLNAAKDENKLNSLRVEHALTFTSGEADLPALVMREYIDSAVLYEDDADALDISFVRSYFDFRRSLYDKFNYFTVKEDTIHFLDQDARSPVELIFIAVTQPALPSSASTTLVLSDSLTDDVVMELARAILGQPPYTNLGSDEKE